MSDDKDNGLKGLKAWVPNADDRMPFFGVDRDVFKMRFRDLPPGDDLREVMMREETYRRLRKQIDDELFAPTPAHLRRPALPPPRPTLRQRAEMRARDLWERIGERMGWLSSDDDEDDYG